MRACRYAQIMEDVVPADSAVPELTAAVARLARAPVLVVGDAMLDRTIYGQVDRISPEAPVPVLMIQRELSVPGGAANVVRNLAALGAATAFVSVVGDDQTGSDLTGRIGQLPGVEPWLLVQGGRVTTMKSRFVSQGQQVLRADHEDPGPVHPRLAERLLRIARDAVPATSATVLSDYRKGVLDGPLPVQLIATARSAGRPVIAGVGGGDLSRYAGVTVMATPWRNIARLHDRESDAAVTEAAMSACERLEFGALLILRTGYGLSLVRPDGPPLHLRAPTTELFDASGAGDTILAVLGAALAAGVALDVAVRLSGLAASIVLGRVGTAVAREADLLSALQPGTTLRKVATREQAAERVERWRRAGWRTGFAHGEFATLAEGDVRLLRQARAACDRLVVGLAESPSAMTQSARAEIVAGLPCVDLVVLEDEATPDELLRALRPELLFDPAGPRGASAELVREWGGAVFEPAE